MADLPTNFKDDILDTSVNTRRRYRVYENTDGTIELEDVTKYSQVGDEFGAGQINAINMEVNKKFDKNMIVRDLDTINAITKEGYVPDALALKEVNSSLGGISFITEEGKGITGYTLTGADTVYPFSSGIKDFAVSYSDVATAPDGTFTFEVGDILLVLYIKQITPKVPVLGIESGAIIIKDQIQCGEGATAMLVKVTDTTVKFTRSNVDHKGQYICFNLSQN